LWAYPECGAAGMKRSVRRSPRCGASSAAGSDGLTIDEINPVWLKTPVAPFAEARIEQIKIDIECIVVLFGALQIGLNMCCGRGRGWLVPLARLTSRPQPMPDILQEIIAIPLLPWIIGRDE